MIEQEEQITDLADRFQVFDPMNSDSDVEEEVSRRGCLESEDDIEDHSESEDDEGPLDDSDSSTSNSQQGIVDYNNELMSRE